MFNIHKRKYTCNTCETAGFTPLVSRFHQQSLQMNSVTLLCGLQTKTRKERPLSHPHTILKFYRLRFFSPFIASSNLHDKNGVLSKLTLTIFFVEEGISL